MQLVDELLSDVWGNRLYKVRKIIISPYKVSSGHKLPADTSFLERTRLRDCGREGGGIDDVCHLANSKVVENNNFV